MLKTQVIDWHLINMALKALVIDYSDYCFQDQFPQNKVFVRSDANLKLLVLQSNLLHLLIELRTLALISEKLSSKYIISYDLFEIYVGYLLRFQKYYYEYILNRHFCCIESLKIANLYIEDIYQLLKV